MRRCGSLLWQLAVLVVVESAVARSPFVKRARAQHVAHEPQFAAAWDATFGESAPGSSQGS